MWNRTNFPAKKLQKDGGSANNYWGAVPTALKTQAAGSDVWVGNTLNRLYFGTVRSGDCGSTGGYTLGTPASLGPIANSSAALPADSIYCAAEAGTCTFSGTMEVWYGASAGGTSGWSVAPAANRASCDNPTLGDPRPGIAKACYYRPYTGSWTPTFSAPVLNTDGFFYGRVQVCNSSPAGLLQDARDYGLCTQYPNGNYKPIGAIQKYGEQMRLGTRCIARQTT